MPLLNYKKQFAPMVEALIKRQTIRAMRKRPFEVGDTLYHYYGLRTKQCRKLLESDCVRVDHVRIDAKGDVFINGRCLYESAKESFAYLDGFRAIVPESAWSKMLTFFKTVHGLPFEGQLIAW